MEGTSNITMGGASGSSDLLAQAWLSRIEKADKYHKGWEDRFKCDVLERYYMGDQWAAVPVSYEPYVINLIFSTIEIKLPTLLFVNPQFHVKPKPQGEQYDFEASLQRSLLRSDLLNTIVSDNMIDFGGEIELAILDGFFRFGIIECGYEADWIMNPNADQPILNSDNKPYTDGEGNVLKQPAKLPQSERLYAKRVPAKRFRVAGMQMGSSLNKCNWCGYWDWVRIEDLKANPNLKGLDSIDWAGGRSSEFVQEEYGPEADDIMRSGDLIKIWKIWDNRKKKMYIFLDSQAITIYEKSFDRLPLFGLRFHKLPEGWLPMPPVANWKSPQDEYNDTREQSRNHRKRFTRKYLYNKSSIAQEEELDKLMNGGDGTFVAVSGELNNCAAPLQNADLGQGVQIGLTVTKDDFNIISGTASEERGQADRTTATQASLINKKAQIRDSRAREQVAGWLQDIGRELLLLAEEKFTLPTWIKMEIPSGNFLDNIPEISHVWHQISFQDLKNKGEDDFNFDVSISLDSQSPLESEQGQQSYLLFLGALSQYPELSADPLLVRETAYKCGYRNEQVIKRMQQAAQLILVQRLTALQNAGSPAGGAAPQGGSMAQQAVANQTPPALEQIRQQLGAQVGGLGT